MFFTRILQLFPNMEMKSRGRGHKSYHPPPTLSLRSHDHQGLPPEQEGDHALSDPIAKDVGTNLHGGSYYKIDATAAADPGESVAIADTEEDPSWMALIDSPDDESHSKDLASSYDLDEVFAPLYPDLPEEDGMKASRNQRLSKGYNSITLTYGEVSVRGVSEIMGLRAARLTGKWVGVRVSERIRRARSVHASTFKQGKPAFCVGAGLNQPRERF